MKDFNNKSKLPGKETDATLNKNKTSHTPVGGSRQPEGGRTTGGGITQKTPTGGTDRSKSDANPWDRK